MNVVINKSSIGNEEYILQENDKTILKVRYRKDLHTARVETVNEQRILIIENEGLLRIRLAIKNEYGVVIGQMTFDNWSDSHGVVQIENIRYRFTVNSKSSPELFIYKDTRRNLIYQCNLSFGPGNQSQLKEQAFAFIISIAWYLHLKAIEEKKPELAV